MLERAEAGHRVERAEGLALERAGVEEVHVETVSTARGELRGGERDADTTGAVTTNDVEQRSPSAAQVEHAPARCDPELLDDELVLARLRLFEGQREVTVVLGAAEVGHLTEAESEHPVDQRIGELEVVAISHGFHPRATRLQL